MKTITTRDVASFVIKMAKPYPVAILVMVLVAIVWAVDLSVRPYLMKVILDRVSEATNDNLYVLLLYPAGGYFLMSFMMSTLFRCYGYFVEVKMIPRLRQRITNTNFSKLLAQSHTFYQNSFSGGLANKVNDLTYSTPEIIHLVIDSFLSNFLALTIAIFTLWQVNIIFAVTMIIWTTIFIGISLYFAPHLTRLSDAWSEIGSSITGKMVDILSNILSVRLFAYKKEETATLNETIEQAVRAEQKLEWSYFWIFFVYGYSFVVYLGVTLYFLIQGRQEGTVSVGDFALVLGINIAIVDFLWQLTKDFSQFSLVMGKATQALRTLEQSIEIIDHPDASQLKITKGEIRFEKVKFHYKGATPLFENKSITILPGQKVGLVGYSGSGKTTFVNLILRLYDVNSGRIMIDGQDIARVTQDSLRKSISMIPQDPSLFNRTLMDNIRYGRADATDKAVVDAAKKAHAHEFIQSLPEKYESFVGERGVKLSGGQRQRISVARAILKNSPILMLDEATSQLDTITERLIQDSLWELMQGKTTLVIAHRLSTLLHMDRILVFDKGKIVEDGNHEELLAKRRLYETLWNAQVGGFLPEDRSRKTKS